MIEKPSNAVSVPSADAYKLFLGELKRRIASAQTRAHLAVSRELILLYWQIGRDIVLRQEQEGWGKSVIEKLSKDLQDEFPGIEGFSANNIWRMRAFYLAYAGVDENLAHAAQEIAGQLGARSRKPILAQAVQEIESPIQVLLRLPWGHNITIVQKVKTPSVRLWYAARASEHGWSRDILALQIDGKLHLRQGKAVTNFKQTLPEPQSDLAQQLVKDPYNFGFLTLSADARERELELGLIEHLSKFLVELGTGFAFVGRQVHIEVGEDDFYIDLLFYHLRLRCFVVIDLKRGAFKPEYASKMNFHLNVVDDKLRHPDDQSSIGLILCQEKKRLIAEYALRGMNKAIGVSEYQLTRYLPKKLKGSLPTIEEIEKELGPSEFNKKPLLRQQ